MSLDDLEPQHPVDQRFEPLNLEDMSIDDLQEYIATLKAEIERVEADIAGKQSQMGAAEALFKS